MTVNLASPALPFLAEALSVLPVGVGVGDRSGNFLTVVGGLAGVLGKRHSSHDPARMARWSIYNEAGDRLKPEDWPSQRALRGETVLPGKRATYTDENGQERHFRIAAAPVELPGSDPGYVFLLQDAREEQIALDQMQAYIQQHLTDIVPGDNRASSVNAAGCAPSRQWPDAEPAVSLTNREQEVLRRFALGYSRKEIAARLGIAVKTVDFYQAAGMRKAGLRNRTDVVQYAIANGWMRQETEIRSPAGLRRG